MTHGQVDPISFDLTLRGPATRTYLTRAVECSKTAVGALRHPIRLVVHHSAIFARVFLGLVIWAYIIYWVGLTTQRFVSLNAYVLDFGAAVQSGSLLLSDRSPGFVIGHILDQGGRYLLLPLTSTGNFAGLIVLQTTVMALAAIPIFEVAERELRDSWTALMLSVSYLLFFPLAGANWYDFHVQVLFVPLFLTGYLAFSRGYYWVAGLLLMASGLLRFPLDIFPALLAAVLVGERWLAGKKIDDERQTIFAFALLGTSCAVLILGYFVGEPLVYGQGQALIDVHVTSSSGFFSNAFYKLLTLLLMLIPFLLIPLWSPRWIPFLIPYTLLLYVSGFWAYTFPYAYSWQYSYGVVPFLYLGTIDCLRKGRFPWTGPRRPIRVGQSHPILRSRRSSVRFVGAFVLCSIAVFALVLQPYGPLNSLSPLPFPSLPGEPYQANQRYNVFSEIASLIPTSSANVLFQDNMPQLLPRPQPFYWPLVPGWAPFQNYTSGDAQNGTITLWNQTGYVSARVSYIVADTDSWTFNLGTPSMASIVAMAYVAGSYGLVAEADGFILLEFGYTGPVKYYLPIEENYTGTSLYDATTHKNFQSNTISFDNVSGNVPLWTGPYSILVPGWYHVTFQLSASDLSTSDQALFQVLAGVHANIVILNAPLNYGTMNSGLSPVTTGFSFYVNNTYEMVQFIVRSFVWTGTLSLHSISVAQLSNGTVTFRAADSPTDRIVYSLIGQLAPGSTVLVVPPYSTGLRSITVVSLQEWFNGSRPAYVVVNPFAGGYSCAPTCNSSFESVVNGILQNGTYGIVYEDAGVLLLERGFKGPPLRFVPFTATYPASSLFVWPGGTMWSGTTLSRSNITSNSPVWLGPYGALPPGSFTVTFSLDSSSNASGNRGQLQVLAGPLAQVVLQIQNISGSEFSAPDVETDFGLSFNSAVTQSFVQYIMRGFVWNGTISVINIDVNQTAP